MLSAVTYVVALSSTWLLVPTRMKLAATVVTEATISSSFVVLLLFSNETCYICRVCRKLPTNISKIFNVRSQIITFGRTKLTVLQQKTGGFRKFYIHEHFLWVERITDTYKRSTVLFGTFRQKTLFAKFLTMFWFHWKLVRKFFRIPLSIIQNPAVIRQVVSGLYWHEGRCRGAGNPGSHSCSQAAIPR